MYVRRGQHACNSSIWKGRGRRIMSYRAARAVSKKTKKE
jgi:hypothetical protein